MKNAAQSIVREGPAPRWHLARGAGRAAAIADALAQIDELAELAATT